MSNHQSTINKTKSTAPKGSFRIITLGCKVNHYESAHITDSLVEDGWSPASENEPADLNIINTCIVTQRASYQSRQAIRKARKENPSGVTIAAGCYAQVFPEELTRIKGVDLILGNSKKAQLSAVLSNGLDSAGSRIISEDFQPGVDFEPLPIKRFLDRTRAFLKIQDGCQSFCSYCIVPYARGVQRSLDPEKVISMLHVFSDEGYKEVVLTGIHMGEYGFDLNKAVDLKGLLTRIGKERLPLRIRLSSIEPKEIDQRLIDMMASEGWICNHFHIPLQSGDDVILKRMNRHYGSSEFVGLIEKIYKHVPLSAIGVDTMAGFPGEDHRAYRNTYSLIKDLPISYLHVFPYSARKGTAAAEFPDQVSHRVIKERAQGLRELGQIKREAFYRSCVGKIFSVLVESWESETEYMVRGLSENYLPVIFPSPTLHRNKIVPIRMERVEGNCVVGRPV